MNQAIILNLKLTAMTKMEMQELIAKGRLKEAIDALRSATKHDAHLSKQVITISSNYSDMTANENARTISFQDLSLKRAQISAGLTSVVDELPESGILATAPLPDPSESMRSTEGQTNSNNKPLFVGGIFLTALVVLSIVNPDWANENAVLFKTLLALAVALFAVLLTGFFHLNIKNVVKGGGALGIFALVYLFNPAGQQKEFDLLVTIVTNENGSIVPVKEKGAELTIQVDETSYKETKNLTEQGEVDFKNIPPRNFKETANFVLASKYYKLKEPKVTHVLKTESMNMEVVPRLIERIAGVVKEANGAGIEGAEIQVGNSALVVYTNEVGNFELEIPAESQKAKLSIIASKEGYEYSTGQAAHSDSYDVVASQNVVVILSKKPAVQTDTKELGSSNGSKAQTDETTYTSFVLKYENKRTPFSFPIDSKIKVQKLRDYICDVLAKEYTSSKVQCQLQYYGNTLELNQIVKELNLPSNAEIYLKCNGNAIPNLRFRNFSIQGKPFTQPIVIVNDKVVNVKKDNVVIRGFTAISVFKMKSTNEVVIYDMSSKQKFIYRNIRIPDDPDSPESEIVLNIQSNGNMTAEIKPKRIVLYEGKNFTGKYSVLYSSSDKELLNAEDLNDLAMSIKVPKGFIIKIYERTNNGIGSGKSVQIDKDCADLSEFGMERKISFIQVVSKPN